MRNLAAAAALALAACGGKPAQEAQPQARAEIQPAIPPPPAQEEIVVPMATFGDPAVDAFNAPTAALDSSGGGGGSATGSTPPVPALPPQPPKPGLRQQDERPMPDPPKAPPPPKVVITKGKDGRPVIAITPPGN
jgi:hypothetical protein